MKLNRWIAGLGVLAAVCLFGLADAGASAFRFSILADDLSNSVTEDLWDAGKKNDKKTESTTTYGGVETSERGVPGVASSGDGNNGHGNNIDGVDSSNEGNSKEGLDSDPTVDDEKATGGSTTTMTKTSSGKGSSK